MKKIRFAPGKGNQKLIAMYNDGAEVWDSKEVNIGCVLLCVSLQNTRLASENQEKSKIKFYLFMISADSCIIKLYGFPQRVFSSCKPFLSCHQLRSTFHSQADIISEMFFVILL